MLILEIILLVLFFSLGTALLLSSHRILDLAWYEANFGKELDPDQLLGFTRALSSKTSHFKIVFEIVATSEHISYLIGTNQANLTNIRELLSSFCPDIKLTEFERKIPALTTALNISLDNYCRPLNIESKESATRCLLAEFKSLSQNETVHIQLILGKRVRPVAVLNQSDVLPNDSQIKSLSRLLLGSRLNFDSDQRKSLRQKIEDPGFKAICRIGVIARDNKRARNIASRICGAFKVLEGPGVRIKIRHDLKNNLSQLKLPVIWPLKLNVNETLAFLFYPLGDSNYPLINRVQSKVLAPSKSISSSGRIVGISTYPSEIRPLGISAKDSLLHLHVLGPTGVGKSTLLLNLIIQDMRANRGVIVIDPKGDLITDIASRIPDNRFNDVVITNPADKTSPVGINPLKVSDEDNKELIADQILSVFHDLYEENWGPRTQDILHASLLTLIGLNDTTLCSIPVLLSNPQYRKQVTANLNGDIGLGPFWIWFESISNAERNQAIAPVMNKVRPFLMRKSIRAILGQKDPKFQIREVFTDKKIVLVSLAKGLLGKETSNLLGSLIVSQIWNATLSRVSIPNEKRHPVMCFFDEFQDYIHLPTDFSDVLAQARGLGLGLTLAHQHLGQLSPQLKQAVLANARNRVCFQLSPSDATVISKNTNNLKSEDFINLSRFEIYANLVANNQVTGFASAKTLEPTQVTSSPSEIFKQSRTRYGIDIAEIEHDIANLGTLNHDLAVVPIGRKKRST